MMLPRTVNVLWLSLLVLFSPSIVSASPPPATAPASSEMVASIKDDGNVLFYSRNRIQNRLPISLESIKLSATDQVEMIDVRDLEGRLQRFAQKVENGRNEITIEPSEPVPVNKSIGLFTVSLHKNLVQKRGETLVFEYDYTPDVATTLKYTAIIPPTAEAISVEPKPKEQAGRRFSWEFQLEANQPFACRIKYSQKAPFGVHLITSEEELKKFASITYGGWRDTSIGGGWAWFTNKDLYMPDDFRLAMKMKMLSAIDEKRRFGVMLDSTNIVPLKLEEQTKDPWEMVAYCFFWSNLDDGKGFSYGVLRQGELVASQKAPPIEMKKNYEIALEKEGNQFGLFVDGKKVLDYTDPALLEAQQTLRFGVHGPMEWKEIKALIDKEKDPRRFKEIIDKLEWTFVGYSKPEISLIGADKQLLEYRKYAKLVDTINTWVAHVLAVLDPIVLRMNGFDEADFSPGETASIEQVANIDLNRFKLEKLKTEQMKEINIGDFHYDVPPERRADIRQVSYAKEGSRNPVLFILVAKAASEAEAVSGAFAVGSSYNDAPDFLQGFYPHLAGLGMRKGRWLIFVSLPLEEADYSELKAKGKVDTVVLYLRSIGAQILMHFYEMDMQAQ